jgi:hypothetical protein
MRQAPSLHDRQRRARRQPPPACGPHAVAGCATRPSRGRTDFAPVALAVESASGASLLRRLRGAVDHTYLNTPEAGGAPLSGRPGPPGTVLRKETTLADDDARQPARQRFGEELTPGGYRCDEVASALQKSIRRGLEREALHRASELELGGWGRYVWKRLTIMVSEDVGLAEPHLPATIWALYENWLEESKRSKEERYAGFRRIFLVHAVVLLARARKSRLLDHALVVVYAGERPSPPVPDFALDRHTQAGRRKGRGYRHFVEEGSKLANEGRRPRPLPRGGRGRAQPPAGTARPAPAVRLASCRCDPA